MKIKDSIETISAIVSIYENGIGHLRFKDNATLDIPEQAENWEAMKKLTNDKKTPFLVSAGDNVIITKEARDNAIKLEDSSPMNASAIIVQNLAYRLIAEFYVKVQKPKNPLKVFTDKDMDKAISWCLQFVEK